MPAIGAMSLSKTIAHYRIRRCPSCKEDLERIPRKITILLTKEAGMDCPGERSLQTENEHLRARIAELEGRTEAGGASIMHKEVFDNLSICVFVLDVTAEGRFKIAAFNPAEEELVGLSNAEVCGRFIEDLFPQDLANELIANYRGCLEAGRTIKFDHQMTLPRQGRRYFHSNLIPLRNAAGTIDRIIGACIETTDFKLTQEAALAKQNLETLGVLAGGIAHDFNNVLGGIHAQAELIEAVLPVGSVALEETQHIKMASTRGSEIVRQLMVYAGQEQSYRKEGIDTSRLIDGMLELLRVSISKHSALTTHLPEDLPTVLGIAPQIRQVVMNLVLNASEAIGQNDGVITLSTAHVTVGSGPGLDGPTGLTPGDYVRVEISDTGSGIAEEVKPKIFEPFFTTKFAGRGMGLAVVQRIVHDHGGSIDMKSSVGHGTTFQVFLPCVVDSTSKINNTISITGIERTDSKKPTILVLEDEELLRQAISKLLRILGYVVVEAGDGSVGMKLMREHKDELEAILLDFTLPGMSSREILEEARRIRPDVRVVITSAYSKETLDATDPYVAGHHFIRKPFPVADLIRLLTDQVSH